MELTGNIELISRISFELSQQVLCMQEIFVPIFRRASLTIVALLYCKAFSSHIRHRMAKLGTS